MLNSVFVEDDVGVDYVGAEVEVVLTNAGADEEASLLGWTTANSALARARSATKCS